MNLKNRPDSFTNREIRLNCLATFGCCNQAEKIHNSKSNQEAVKLETKIESKN
jgi:hypothetical protein